MDACDNGSRAVLKTVAPKGVGGSNPSASATYYKGELTVDERTYRWLQADITDYWNKLQKEKLRTRDYMVYQKAIIAIKSVLSSYYHYDHGQTTFLECLEHHWNKVQTDGRVHFYEREAYAKIINAVKELALEVHTKIVG